MQHASLEPPGFEPRSLVTWRLEEMTETFKKLKFILEVLLFTILKLHKQSQGK